MPQLLRITMHLCHVILEKRAKVHGRCLPIHELGGARRLRVGNLTQEGEVVAVLVLAQQALIRLDLGEKGGTKSIQVRSRALEDTARQPEVGHLR